ncbi:MAG: hypothetical protein H6737_24240 [Alphaproteobacteria bacterium]|nr:hypothetical protein [Alphaproteobacteria bacterium]
MQKALPPRRKRMTRKQRLAAAPKWRRTYGGHNVVRAYAKWFGVDRMCALTELRMLGVKIDPVYAAQVERDRNKPIRPRKPKKQPADELPEGYGVEWDDELAFIAGYTDGGAPYGISWDEWPFWTTGVRRAGDPLETEVRSGDDVRGATAMSDAFDFLEGELGFAPAETGARRRWVRDDLAVEVLEQRYHEVSVLLKRGAETTSLNAIFEALRFEPADTMRTAYRAPDGEVHRFSTTGLASLAEGLRRYATPWLRGEAAAWDRSTAYAKAFSALNAQRMSPPPGRPREVVFTMAKQLSGGDWTGLEATLRGLPALTDRERIALDFLERYGR